MQKRAILIGFGAIGFAGPFVMEWLLPSWGWALFIITAWMPALWVYNKELAEYSSVVFPFADLHQHEMFIKCTAIIVAFVSISGIIFSYFVGTPPDDSERPYFTPTKAGIVNQNHEEETGEFQVQVKNNGAIATDISSEIWVIPIPIDLNAPPIYKTANPRRTANPVGLKGIFIVETVTFHIPPNTDPAFVVLKLKYSGSEGQKQFSQMFFFGFKGSSASGEYDMNFRHATEEERIEIEHYLLNWTNNPDLI